MSASFQDYFSDESASYAEFRPTYPAALFAWLASIAPGRELAWDAGTGSGQAAVPLASYFLRVIATDASASQLAHATPHPRVLYRPSTAGEDGLAPASVDLVTVAQALHWFDRPAFWAEVRRVLRPEGCIAAWCYGLLTVSPEVDPVVTRLYRDVLGPWWPPDRSMVDAGYRTIEFPFAECTPPAFAMEATWTLRDLVGYLGTWSAVRRHRAHTGEEPVQAVLPELAAAWGDPFTSRPIRWPLGLRVGRVLKRRRWAGRTRDQSP